MKAARKAKPKRGPGRPPLLTAKQFKAGAKEYFHYCDNRLKTFVDDEGDAKTQVCQEPYSIAGLCDYFTNTLGIRVYVQRISEWAKGGKNGECDPELSEAIKDVLLKIHADWSRRLQESKNPAGVIFYGKAALGYRDVQVVEQSGPNGQPERRIYEVIYPQAKEQADEQAPRTGKR